MWIPYRKLSCFTQLCWQESDGKVQTFGKRCQAAKRDPNCAVVIRGWLNKKVFFQWHTHACNDEFIKCWFSQTEWLMSASLYPGSCRTALVWSYGRDDGLSSPTTVCSTIKVYSLLPLTLSAKCSDCLSGILFTSLLSLSLPDSREESVLGSIPLPSYKILFCTPRECKNRKFTFKVSLFVYSLNLGRRE